MHSEPYGFACVVPGISAMDFIACCWGTLWIPLDFHTRCKGGPVNMHACMLLLGSTMDLVPLCSGPFMKLDLPQPIWLSLF